MKVVYVGVSDNRVLSKADIEKMGAKLSKADELRFPKGQAVEVTNEVGQALLEHKLVAGQFSEEGAEDASEDGGEGDDDPDTSNLLVNLGPDGPEQGGQENANTGSSAGGGETTDASTSASATTPTGAARTASAARSAGASRSTSGKPGAGRGRSG